MAKSDHILVKMLDDPSFVRWINGKAGRQEREKWERWEQEFPYRTELKKKAEKLYLLPLGESDGDVEKQLAQLHQRINDHEKVFRISSMPRSKRRGRGYYQAVAAAVVLLIAVVGVLAFYNQPQPQTTTSELLYSTIEVGYGEKGALKISDGSSIRLNANSSLRYSPEQFNTSSVEVWLEGEAYFSIVRNPGNKQRSFVVHTPDGDIRVLGTRFNVNTRFHSTGVVLEEGSIEVLLKDSLQHIVGQHVLKPGQKAQFESKESSMQVQRVDTSLYTAWLDGKLVFENAPLKEIIQNIEATYGVSIEVEEPALLNEKISGSLRNPDLKTLLKGMEEVLHLNIEKKSDKTFLISKQDLPQIK